MRLWYDTETTGLIDWNLRSLDPAQPRIVQMAAMMDGTEYLWNIGGTSGLGLEVPREVTIEQALQEFWGLYMLADDVAAWNEKFDARMIRIELLRLGRSDLAESWEARTAFEAKVGNRALGGSHDALGDVRAMVAIHTKSERRTVEWRRR